MEAAGDLRHILCPSGPPWLHWFSTKKHLQPLEIIDGSFEAIFSTSESGAKSIWSRFLPLKILVCQLFVMFNKFGGFIKVA
jgi:hypothetical protein